MRPLLIPALAALILSAPLAKAETVSIQTARGPATLVLADEIERHPVFAGFMRDDARAIVDDYETEEARRITVEDRATYVDGRYASVARRIEADIGGAAPNIYIEGIVWDGEAEDFTRLDHFFDAGEARDEAFIAISRHLREMIRIQVWGGRIDRSYAPLVDQATSPDAAVLSNFTIRPGAAGLTFHYSPFEVAPYERGVIQIAAPTAIFAKWLNRSGQDLF